MEHNRIILSAELPEYPAFKEGIRRAPDRGYTLSDAKTVTALKNALRYLPEELHEKVAPEFLRNSVHEVEYMPIAGVRKEILRQNQLMSIRVNVLPEKHSRL